MSILVTKIYLCIYFSYFSYHSIRLKIISATCLKSPFQGIHSYLTSLSSLFINLVHFCLIILRLILLNMYHCRFTFSIDYTIMNNTMRFNDWKSYEKFSHFCNRHHDKILLYLGVEHHYQLTQI